MGRPAARTWSGNIVPSAYDARYPREDALTRMYATAGRRRPQAGMMPWYDDDNAQSPSFLVDGR
ncbi:unnamed protein product [Strongylus vulgaris]|uniref:Uncharacterized protein n=1 Tax=Strongylus vulgaris TaxID=40348 RepID=A0A3P7IRQ4_STRVU|nr:unnamed protein product [Strongylus vulgaris]